MFPVNVRNQIWNILQGNSIRATGNNSCRRTTEELPQSVALEIATLIDPVNTRRETWEDGTLLS